MTNRLRWSSPLRSGEFHDLMNLLPRDDKFFAFFLKQVDIICQAARVLLEGVRIGDSRLASAATEISVLEHRGDEVIHSIFTG